ncbi:MAG TPA: OB-fold nucleic acid binding domain-containing protein [bacterium]|nr:OB-fold nucleic acid binding domain-containing protein [bacterium]HOL67538.1 OB-fold nucleic acid binding domain-containing protein [bacterium]
MKRKISKFFFLAGLLIIWQRAACEIVPATKAAQFAGTTQTVRGLVVSTKYAAGSKGKPTFLNLEKPYPEQIFTVVIWGQDRPKFEKPPEQLYRGKVIRVTGVIKVYQNVPEIEVSSPQQIEIELNP